MKKMRRYDSISPTGTFGHTLLVWLCKSSYTHVFAACPAPPTHMYTRANIQDYTYEDFCYGRRRWDNSHILRKQLAFLVPAFDPRPGKSFIPALQELKVPAPGSEQPVKHVIPSSSQTVLKLTLKVRGEGCVICEGVGEEGVMCGVRKGV